MSRPSRMDALQHMQLIKRLEDQELLDLVEDTIARLNDLGDRLEVFAKGETRDGEGSDGSRNG